MINASRGLSRKGGQRPATGRQVHRAVAPSLQTTAGMPEDSGNQPMPQQRGVVQQQPAQPSIPTSVQSASGPSMGVSPSQSYEDGGVIQSAKKNLANKMWRSRGVDADDYDKYDDTATPGQSLRDAKAGKASAQGLKTREQNMEDELDDRPMYEIAPSIKTKPISDSYDSGGVIMPSTGDPGQAGDMSVDDALSSVMDTLAYGRQKSGLSQGGQQAQNSSASFADGGSVIPFPKKTGYPDIDTMRQGNTRDTLNRALGGGPSNVVPMTPPTKSYADGGSVDNDDPVVAMQDQANDESQAYGPDANPAPDPVGAVSQGVIPTPQTQPEAPDANAMAGAAGSGPNPPNTQAPSVVGYLKGSDAADPQTVMQAEQQADPSGTMSDDLKKLMVIANAPDDDTKWGFMQHYRQKYDAFKAFAAAALTGVQGKAADIGAAARAATKAYSSIPDGNSIAFTPTQAGGVVATVKSLVKSGAGSVQPEQIPLTGQQFSQFLRGLPGQFDNLMDSDAVQVLKRLASSGGQDIGEGNINAPGGAAQGAQPNSGIKDYLAGVGQRASRFLPSTSQSSLPGEADINAPGSVNMSRSPTPPPAQQVSRQASAQPAAQRPFNVDQMRQMDNDAWNTQRAKASAPQAQRGQGAGQQPQQPGQQSAFPQDIVARANELFPAWRTNPKGRQLRQQYIIRETDAREGIAAQREAAKGKQDQAGTAAQQKAMQTFLTRNPDATDDQIANFQRRIQMPTGGQAAPQASAADAQAIEWANANPTDPRAAKIKQRLGIQ